MEELMQRMPEKKAEIRCSYDDKTGNASIHIRVIQGGLYIPVTAAGRLIRSLNPAQAVLNDQQDIVLFKRVAMYDIAILYEECHIAQQYLMSLGVPATVELTKAPHLRIVDLVA